MADWWVESFRDVLIAVPPQIGATSGELTFGAGAVISVPPLLDVDAAGASLAEVAIDVSPSMGIGMPARGSVDLTVAPLLTMDAIANMARDMVISVPPTMGVGGAGNSTAAVTVSVAPVVSVAGVGNDGVSAVTAGTPAGMSADAYATNATFTLTATTGDYAMVDVVAASATAPSSVTHDGHAMTLLASRQIGSDAAYLHRYGIAGIASGAKTVSVTFASLTIFYAAGIPLSNVVTVGTPTTAGGLGTPSQAATCSSGDVIVHAFAGYTATFSTATGPARVKSYTGTYMRHFLATATASSTFGDTATGIHWAGIATVFTPV